VRTVREPATAPTEPFDAQQTLMLEVLGRAQGEPVSYEALRDAGVEYPASVASELELVGVQLERPLHAARPRREPLGVRLPPQREHELDRPRFPPSPESEADARSREGVLAIAAGIIDAEARALAGDARRLARTAAAAARGGAESIEPTLRSLADGPRRRLIAPAALLAVLVIVAVLAIVDLAGSSPARRPAPLHLSATNAAASRASQAARRAAASTKATASSAQPAATPSGSAANPAQAPATASPPGAAPTQSSPAPPVPAPTQVTAAQLEAEGHALLASGEAARAIPVLRDAVSATGQTLSRCLAPSSEACLTYAYALYDLGTALRLAGQSSEAVPILEQRLQIANQRGTVRQELRLARGPGAGGVLGPGPHGGGDRGKGGPGD